MLIPAPEEKELTALVGKSLYGVWNKLCALIDEHYDMDLTWNNGGKAWTYEYKFRRRGKTLCALYAKESRIGFMVILGKDERVLKKIEASSQARCAELTTTRKLIMTENGSCLSL